MIRRLFLLSRVGRHEKQNTCSANSLASSSARKAATNATAAPRATAKALSPAVRPRVALVSMLPAATEEALMELYGVVLTRPYITWLIGELRREADKEKLAFALTQWARAAAPFAALVAAPEIVGEKAVFPVELGKDAPVAALVERLRKRLRRVYPVPLIEGKTTSTPPLWTEEQLDGVPFTISSLALIWHDGDTNTLMLGGGEDATEGEI